MTIAVIHRALHDTNDILQSRTCTSCGSTTPCQYLVKVSQKVVGDEAVAYSSASSPNPISRPIASAAAAAVWWVEDRRGVPREVTACAARAAGVDCFGVASRRPVAV